MTVHSMYLKLQLMHKDNFAPKNYRTYRTYVETTLGAEATGGRRIWEVHEREEEKKKDLEGMPNADVEDVI